MQHLLVVEDEPVHRKHLQRDLSEAGYQVAVAADFDEAVRASGRRPPDLLIADLTLAAGRDGLELVESLRGARPELKAILMTGLPTDEVRARARALGVSLLVEKPFRMQALREAVRLALDGRQGGGRWTSPARPSA